MNNNVEYVYSNNEYNETYGLSEEEINALREAQLREMEEEESQRKANRLKNISKKIQGTRIGKSLKHFPGSQQLISRAKSKVETRKRAKNMELRKIKRNSNILLKSRKAREKYKQNITNPLNLEFGSNNSLQAEEAVAAANENFSRLNDIQTRMISKSSAKNAALNTFKQAYQVSAQAENARLFDEAKTVLQSEDKKHRQTVLKTVALDDLIAEENKKLALANTNRNAENAAARLYDLVELKNELEQARQEDKNLTPEQESRYNALTSGVEFNNTSLYKRLIPINANLSRQNNILNAQQRAKFTNNASVPMVPLETVAAAASSKKNTTQKPNLAQRERNRLARLAYFSK